MKRLAALLLLAFSAWLLLPAPLRGEPAPTILVEVSRPGGRDLPIALPRPVGDASEAEELWSLLERDLAISGYFRQLPHDATLEPPGAGLRPGTFRFEDWDPAGTVVLARTGVQRVPQGYRVEVWVYDVPGRRKLGARAFTGREDQLRTLGHRVADEIVRLVTGEPGIFRTRFAAVSSATGNKEIVLVDIDGERVVPVTRNGSINLQPAWSPAGDALAFTSYRAGNPDVYIADLRRGRVRRISSRAGVNSGAAWSPVQRLLALTLTVGGDSDVFLVDPDDGHEVRRLTRSPGIDAAPAFSPDGRWVAFASERSGGLQVYVMPTAGGPARRVTFRGDHNTDPAFSPDGSRIAYVSRNGRFDIWTVGIDGEDPARVTADQGDNEDPSWAPNGHYIAFASNRERGRHIWIASPDGRHQVRITQGAGVYSNPAWSPVLDW